MAKAAYLVASRQGLYLVTREEWRLLVEGRFFGLALADGEVFACRHEAPDSEEGPLSGQIVRYEWTECGLVERAVVAKGLHHNGHQLDFFDDAFFLVDTANQTIVEFDRDWRLRGSHAVLPPADPEGPDHGHVNSIAGTAETVWVMLHNHARGRTSEIIEYDRAFRERRRIDLPCSGCHDVVPLPDGRLLTCLSPLGEIAFVPGEAHRVDQYWTRGLVVAPDEIVVGSSYFGHRVGRALLPGFLTFLDPVDYRRIARVYLPAAPTQIRKVELRAGIASLDSVERR